MAKRTLLVPGGVIRRFTIIGEGSSGLWGLRCACGRAAFRTELQLYSIHEGVMRGACHRCRSKLYSDGPPYYSDFEYDFGLPEHGAVQLAAEEIDNTTSAPLLAQWAGMDEMRWEPPPKKEKWQKLIDANAKRKREKQNDSDLVSHASCADGYCSAMIIKAALPEIEVKFVTYGTEYYKQLKAEEGMIFCDMTPPRDRAQEFVDAGAIVLDHHKGAKDIVEMFGANGDYREDMSGAMLAQEYFGTLASREMALSADAYDRWQKTSPWYMPGCYQSAYLMTVNWRDILIHEPRLTMTELSIGKAFHEERERRAKLMVGKAATGEMFDGGRVCLTNDTSGLASLYGEAARQAGFDLAVSYSVYERDNLVQFSLRSNADVIDSDAIAKMYGGGGHKAAAGFTLTMEQYIEARNSENGLFGLVGAQRDLPNV